MPVAERFLIVDDEPNITAALAKVVTSMGYEAIVYNDPREAAEVSGVDLIITDFMMPHLSGIDLLSQIKKRNPDIVRLLVTAASDFKVAMRAVNEGEVFKLLSKPWSLAELRGAIDGAVKYARLIRENKRLSLELAERNEQLRTLNATLEQQVVERTSGLLDGMVRALDHRDSDTQWHSRRVARVTRRLAEAIGIHGEQLVHIEQGALLHDIGKIGVPDAILLKPGPLSPEEWVEMKKHPEAGFRMLQNIPYLRPAAQIVYEHQEKWNGQGYPRGIKGEEICIGARLFCVADAMDAIVSDRPYRKGSPLEFALAEIRRLRNIQFDPTIVDAFLAISSQEWLHIRAEIEALEKNERSNGFGLPKA